MTTINWSFSNDHEWFFSDICLQYLSKHDKENIVAEPESELIAAFQVTRSSSTQIQGSAGLNLSNVPSGSASLGITRSRNLEVSYAVNTWSISAHQIANG